ncbi:hypothetical protein CTheo_6243 [Ceratobasidium theobromae]|uniref:MACPF-like domain-containing protein n=1 Tax=Ceratobasidium theobromae TaxID=1582974 RepID=A0A5N5QEX8_9AGAM|nr:hypothetical protein CTheo_6243 [Ceratobasidium theobromae]
MILNQGRSLQKGQYNLSVTKSHIFNHDKNSLGMSEKDKDASASAPAGAADQKPPVNEPVVDKEKGESSSQPAGQEEQPAAEAPKKEEPKAPSKPEAPSSSVYTFLIKIIYIDIPPDEENGDGLAIAEGGEEAEAKDDDEDKDEEADKADKADKAAKSEAPPKKTVLTTIEYENLSFDDFKTKTLSSLRPRVTQATNKTFRFSDEGGAMVEEKKAFSSYFGLGAEVKPEQTKDFKVYIIPFKRDKVSAAELLDNPPFILKFVQKLKDDEVERGGTLYSNALPTPKKGDLTLRELRKHIKGMSSLSAFHQFCLEDGFVVEDSMTLKNYVSSLSNAIEGDETSKGTPAIEIYFRKPGALKKAKRKGASEEVKAFLKELDKDFKAGDKLDVERKKTLEELREDLKAEDYKLGEDLGDAAKSAGMLTEDEWKAVIRNCNLMIGWVTDVKANRLVRAPKAAFKLRDGLNLEKPSKKAIAPATKSEEADADVAEVETEVEERARAIPNFAIDDASRVEITSVTSDFQESMAKANFSASSIEASVSGGYAGISAGISASYGQEDSSKSSSSSQRSEKTLIGTYRFPRATVYLTPSDLEPTDDLKSAIKKIRLNKDIADLRQLHRDFGHLFCHKVVIGGSLQTTKISKLKQDQSESEEKSQFKASIGATVQSPVVNVEVKASHEEGSSNTQGKQESESRESLVFEATGGNTILVSDPVRWTASLADYNHWRVIDQDKISSLAEAISQIPGYSDAQMWFMQAVPSLSKYIEIPQSRTLNVRMKAVANRPELERLLGNQHYNYLGHDIEKPPELVHMGLEVNEDKLKSGIKPMIIQKGRPILDMTVFTETKHFSPSSPLFSPNNLLGNLSVKITSPPAPPAQAKPVADLATTAADLVKSAADLAKAASGMTGKEGDAAKTAADAAKTAADAAKTAAEAAKTAATEKDPVKTAGTIPLTQTSESDPLKTFKSEYLKTVWKLELPDGQILAHESRVNIKSLSSSAEPTLSVYRNQQGVYLPALNSHDGPSFWRILKNDPRSQTGDAIRDGDEIRLSWRFSDQTDGFRDFYDDTFGRRRYTNPDIDKIDENDRLFLKIPYPSFDMGNSTLVLSSAETVRPVVEMYSVLHRQGMPAGQSQLAYNLHDITFRLDSAGSDGLGEVKDYLAPNSAPDTLTIPWAPPKVEFSGSALMVANMIIPSAKSSFTAALLKAALL